MLEARDDDVECARGEELTSRHGERTCYRGGVMSSSRKPNFSKTVMAGSTAVLEGEGVLALVELGLLDSVLPQLPSGLMRRMNSSLTQSLFAGRSESDAAHIGPLLLQVSAADTAWLVKFAQPLHAVSWIVPRQSLMAIRSNLSAHLDARSDDGLGFVMRYYDPRLLEAYCELADSLHWQHALQGIAQWHWINPWGELCSLDVPDGIPAPLQKDALGRTEQQLLDAGQLASLARLCEPGALLEILRANNPAALSAWARPNEHALASYFVRVAAAHGLESMAGQVAYSLDALRLHPLLHTHPLVRKQLATGISLDTVVDSLNREQCDALAAELRSGQPMQNFLAPFGYAHQKLGTQ